MPIGTLVTIRVVRNLGQAIDTISKMKPRLEALLDAHKKAGQFVLGVTRQNIRQGRQPDGQAMVDLQQATLTRRRYLGITHSRILQESGGLLGSLVFQTSKGPGSETITEIGPSGARNTLIGFGHNSGLNPQMMPGHKKHNPEFVGEERIAGRGRPFLGLNEAMTKRIDSFFVTEAAKVLGLSTRGFLSVSGRA